MKDFTTISIKKKTKDKLDKLKQHPRATYAEVIADLVEKVSA